MPIGFAGGLVDRDTGLIRFGYRDYDPHVGRFTAPDPAGDRRGDGDLYDYCVDDPVSRVDPLGLAFTGVSDPSDDSAKRKTADKQASASVATPQQSGQPSGAVAESQAAARTSAQQQTAQPKPAKRINVYAPPALEEIRKQHLKGVSALYPEHSQEGLKHELLIKQAEWQRQGDQYVLMENGKPVPGSDKRPIRIETAMADSIGKQSKMSYDIGMKQAVAVGDAAREVVKNGAKTDPIGLTIGLVGSAPDAKQELTLAGKAASAGEYVASAARRAADPNEPKPRYDSNEFTYREKHQDAIIREMYSSKSDFLSKEFDDEAAEEHGDNSRRALNRKQTSERGGKSIGGAKRFSEEEEGKALERFEAILKERHGGKENPRIMQLLRHCRADWTPEHMEKVAQQYRRTEALLDGYVKTLPEGTDRTKALEHMKTWADTLQVGTDIPLLQSMIGIAAGKGVAATPLGKVPGVEAALSGVAEEMARRGFQTWSRRGREKQLMETYKGTSK